MKKSFLMRGITALALAGVMAVSATGMASADTPNSNPAVSPNSTGTQLVGGEYTDVSKLTIVGTINPATGQITDVTPHHPAPLSSTPPSAPEAGQASLQTTQPDCDGRTDFYRIIDTDGYTRCFANSGSLALDSGYWSNIILLCPGNNEGRTEWVDGSTNTWSLWRGPEADYNTCYSFDYGVPAFAVQIA
ncbi:type IV pilin N-terminal domain-containing protein [Agreia bicolorata]|uniref:type IV pilin N-terminal domain-containing protein n=1 Tax=Agreia bicolorata TaxID=110935 RepID=UPI0011174EC9|nr:type IV pilin N-terminal domain-containing protein [Agreia bicolorata]